MPLIILIQIGMIMLSRLSILSFLLNVEEARSGCPCIHACFFDSNFIVYPAGIAGRLASHCASMLMNSKKHHMILFQGQGRAIP